MSPAEFLATVVQPNMQTALEQPNDLRAIVNAVLTVDALPGFIHAAGVVADDPAMMAHKADDDFRAALATISPSYRVLRDMAAALKHGDLDRKRKRPRLVRSGGAARRVRNMCGLYQCGDSLGGSVVVIEFDPGPGYVRASNVIADSFRMLRRIVEGEPARRDEHEGGTFAIMGGDAFLATLPPP
jgi:hypothetical protein